jgi:biopolymer transport protein ExbB
MYLLVVAGKNTTSLTKTVMDKIDSGADSQEALQAIENKNGSVARVIKATLRNLERDRLHLEDIISEHMLNESSRLDRFNSIILVFAAVAPLLGLLGTVTGMIATFDIITEYGTGDPKLLAGGISIALVTTELGLIVAIPLLLVGNLLSGWASRIKDQMEHSALSIVNIYHKRNG